VPFFSQNFLVFTLKQQAMATDNKIKNRKILVIEDDPDMQKLYKDFLSDYAEVIQAFNLTEAKVKFAVTKNFTHILVDACLGGNREDGKPDTTELVPEMRRTFTGIMIAISSDSDRNNFLVSLGCDRGVEKGHSVVYMIDLLEQENS